MPPTRTFLAFAFKLVLVETSHRADQSGQKLLAERSRLYYLSLGWRTVVSRRHVVNQKFLLLLTGITLAASQATLGQTYTGSLLYPLTVPSSNGATFNSISDNELFGTIQVAVGGSTYNHAVLWPGNSTSVDLNPAGYMNSFASGSFGDQQVGRADNHAMLWTGSAASAVDLQPATLTGINYSFAEGISSTQQVGDGFAALNSDTTHALLWTGSAAIAVDLSPTGIPGIISSQAIAADGKTQVGAGDTSVDPPDSHALLWSGTADSAIDLNPTNLSGINQSVAFGVGGNQQVGTGYGTNISHAILWTGSAASAVDLNPTDLSGIISSTARGTNGTVQVGYALTTPFDDPNAILWFGTAASAVNLQSLLPSNVYWYESEALTVDASGNVFGWGEGFSFQTESNTYYAVEWSPVPEPGTISLLLISCVGLLARRTRLPLQFQAKSDANHQS